MLRHDQRISVIGTFIVSRWISRRVWASYRHPGELSPAESDLIERERVREMAELLLSVATCSYQKTWTIWICSITPVPILSQTYHQPLITRYQSSLRISETEIQLSAVINSQRTFYSKLGWLIKTIIRLSETQQDIDRGMSYSISCSACRQSNFSCWRARTKILSPQVRRHRRKTDDTTTSCTKTTQIHTLRKKTF